MSAWTVYLITRLDAVKSVGCGLLAVGVLLAGIVWWFVLAETGNKVKFSFKKVFLIMATIFTFIGLSAITLVPTTKEAAAIYLIPKLANNKDIQAIGKDSIKLLKGHLEKYLDELEKDKSETTP